MGIMRLRWNRIATGRNCFRDQGLPYPVWFLASIVDEDERWNGSPWSAGLPVVWSRVVDELALRKPPSTLPYSALPPPLLRPAFGPPLVSPWSRRLSRIFSFFDQPCRSSLPSPSFLFCPALSSPHRYYIYSFFRYNSSGGCSWLRLDPPPLLL